MTRARVALLHAPAKVRGIALLLHGGPVSSTKPDLRLSPAYLRMLAFGPTLVARSHGHLVVAALRYRMQGWNEPDAPAVQDAEDALDRIQARYPDRPIAVIGHSMGGRVALRVAGHSAVRVVVGVSAWLPETDPRPPVDGRSVLLLHGTHDLITPWKRSRQLAEDLRADGVDATFVPLPRRGHNLLLTTDPHRAVADFVVDRMG
ncbi:alpha/beta hydrolase family protein [Arsenicicoccus sp. oral taxon 190]|uniref:alpha/beta hydrolase family protein n=1 Tax=Arsenicicoccus sp. oral taxon 190 TaxID=1658671 RepID=UPI000679EC1C|nr:alpha/beta fold hydrolase [Arsenicicoccus sp. oral taxon 190]AKT50546.1 hypothetical protein ADJ73_03115 [Arsenicicoccus sp. oral taxon 190]